MEFTDIKNNVTALERFWSERNKQMKEWYEMIRMVDTLAQKDMESFVGNDPRAAINLINGILDQPIPHRIPSGKLTIEDVGPAAELSEMFDTIWENIVLSYRERGRDYFNDLRLFLLATGWYSVFTVPSMDGSSVLSEVWNPATVYPRWDNMLIECAHIFNPGGTAIKNMADRNGWNMQSTYGDTTKVKDYWWVEQGLNMVLVHNAILVGEEMVKPDTIEIRFDRIPIFTGYAGGLPDTGELAKGRATNVWKGEIGQSVIAPNANIYMYFNKWWSFLMQLVRDTAQARTYEKTNSPKQIVTPENWYRRGGHFKLGQQDDLGFIEPPQIPVELRGMQLDLEAMAQRGGPSWTMFGSIQNRMTAYAMAQVAATTNQIAGAYHQAVINCISDQDNFLYKQIKDNKFKPYGKSLPEKLPADLRLSADYELKIPGDLIQRATTARTLNPQFELSDERIYSEIFPEIKDTQEEKARVNASKARKDPIFVALSLIATLREEARLLREAGDVDGADLYEAAAKRKEQELMISAQGAPSTERTMGARPETIPPTEPRLPAESRVGER